METGEPVPVWHPVRLSYPVRLLGTIGGFVMMYGANMLMIRRWRKSGRTVCRSVPSDWLFLWLLLAGSAGFVVALALYLPEAPIWGHTLFLFHVAVPMEPVLLAPCTRFGTGSAAPCPLLRVADPAGNERLVVRGSGPAALPA